MNSLRILSFFAAMLGCVAMTSQAGKQQPAQSESSNTSAALSITGVWRCETDSLPAISMVISDEGGSLTGALLFYFHMRKTANDSYTSTPGLPEPMFNVQLDGNRLTFQVSHRRAHPPRTLNDPPVSFRLTITGPNQGELVNESENGPGCTMVRSDY